MTPRLTGSLHLQVCLLSQVVIDCGHFIAAFNDPQGAEWTGVVVVIGSNQVPRKSTGVARGWSA